MEPGTVESVINAVESCAHLSKDAEINIEANPTSVEVKKLRYVLSQCQFCNLSFSVILDILLCRDFKEAGVTRLSLGVQVYRVFVTVQWHIQGALRVFEHPLNVKECSHDA